MAQYNNVPFARLILVSGESTSEHCPRSEDLEVVRRYMSGVQLNWFACSRECHLTAAPRGHIFEDRVLVAPVQIIERGDPVSLADRRLLHHHDDAAGVGVRQGFQKHAIDEAEDGGVRAD